ncbi:hypothetical protein [Rhizobium setariae]
MEVQRRSFAYGNTHFENSLITREMVNKIADEMPSPYSIPKVKGDHD